MNKIEQIQPGDLYAFTNSDDQAHRRYTDAMMIVSADPGDQLGIMTWRDLDALTDGDGAAIMSWSARDHDARQIDTEVIRFLNLLNCREVARASEKSATLKEAHCFETLLLSKIYDDIDALRTRHLSSDALQSFTNRDMI